MTTSYWTRWGACLSLVATAACSGSDASAGDVGAVTSDVRQDTAALGDTSDGRAGQDSMDAGEGSDGLDATGGLDGTDGLDATDGTDGVDGEDGSPLGPNRPPVFDSDLSIDVTEGVAATFALETSDPDAGQTVVVEVVDTPPGVTFDVATGSLSAAFGFDVSTTLRARRLPVTVIAKDDGEPSEWTWGTVWITVQNDQDQDGLADPVDPDADDDGKEGTADNCPLVSNPDQADLNGDGKGDPCDDLDDDGVPNYVDNCVLSPNPGQADPDGDGSGFGCDQRERVSTNPLPGYEKGSHDLWYADADGRVGGAFKPTGDVGAIQVFAFSLTENAVTAQLDAPVEPARARFCNDFRDERSISKSSRQNAPCSRSATMGR